jgi:hypothetical protein
MNTLKKTLALVATLAMAATALASCGDDSSSSTSESKADTTKASEDTTKADTSEASTGEIDASVKTGGDTFTVAAWNHDDVPALIASWKGLNADTIVQDLADGKVEGIKFIDFGVGGGKASENYDQLFNDGTDLDVYFVEADWALKYINDDSRTLPLSKLGLGDSDFANIYKYTDEIGKDSNGVRKGISWQAAAGGFAYRADLAKEYLGAETPADMQKQINNWDNFVAAAKTVSEKSSGSVALADSLGGLW